jgi:DNA repair protein RecN (Recombination protein N)
MIESLRIENLAVLERAELELGTGLHVLTGETGAGKSIVLGALALLAGSRASQDVIREGAEEAVVEAVFRVEGDAALLQRLARLGVEPSEGTLVVRRSVARNGRGRARVGGELVPVATLAELFRGRLEISSQHESQELLRTEAHARLLDAAGGLLPLCSKVAEASERLRAVDREIAQLEERREERARREDFLKYQMNEIDEAKLKPGEFADLQAEKARLGNSERLRGEAEHAVALLAPDPTRAEVYGALDPLAEAVRRLEALTEIDPGLTLLAERLAAARTEVEDASQDLSVYAADVEADPARLAEAEERLDQLERLRRKYGGDEDAISAFREEAARELAALAGSEDRLAELQSDRVRIAESLARDADRLSAGRRRAAARLASAVEEQLHGLAMPDARFEVGLEPVTPPEGVPCSSGGAEAPQFRFCANLGEPLQPLRRVVSGGELSRVFLALKCALRKAGEARVLVFDEVDAGIGGRVADQVGRLLSDLARDHQVLCITHLPQIAAGADLHFRVDKRKRAGRTVTGVHRLERAARIEEIARMAGGATVSDATRRHAQELLRSRRR